MPSSLTIRNVPDDVHRALKQQATRNGRSLGAEVRAILSRAVKPETHVPLGDALPALSQQIGLTNEDFDALEWANDHTPAVPMEFDSDCTS
jgi:antitoxin FitA